MSALWKDHLHLHFIVLLFGFTAILGKLISLPATDLVAYRMFLAALGLGAYIALRLPSFRLPPGLFWPLCATGGIVALHWTFFFAAVKVSNVSVTLGCMAAATLFTAFLEPIFEKRKIDYLEIALGLCIIVGLYIITRFAFHFYLGIIYALISAFLGALFGVLNQRFTRKCSAELISFYELCSGAFIVFAYLLFSGQLTANPIELHYKDALYLLVLAWICTSYAFVGCVALLKRLSAYTVSLAINMEPVYGIILAFLIFGESEKMHTGFYMGALIIIIAIVVYPLQKAKSGKN